MTDTNKALGNIISQLRKHHGWTQSQLAGKLYTSQSAIVRMESGRQNFTISTLDRLSGVLGRQIINLGGKSLNFQIKGGQKLRGEITTKVSKNSAVGLLAASLLNKGTTTLKYVPRIEEVHRLVEVLNSIGVSVKWNGDDLIIKPPAKLDLNGINHQAARATRSILMFIGPLIHIYKDFSLPSPGGCRLGDRTVLPHIYMLEEFGAKIDSRRGSYVVKVRSRRPSQVVLYETGDTVTENAIMAAARTPGKTVIKYASGNYMVQDMCHYLKALGVRVEGIGSNTLTIYGRETINKNITYYPTEDPIESMMFLALAAITRSYITIKRCPIDFLELELLKMEKMGFRYKIARKYKARNATARLVDIETLPSELKASQDKIEARPHGINIDNLPFFVLLAAAAKGRTLIHDWVFENRAIYYTELNKLGANVELADIHRAYVAGPTKYKASQVICPPALRPAAIILLAMIAAPGESTLRNVYSINRGYEDIASRLNKLGADITVMSD